MMKCQEFQKKIPQIIDRTVPDEELYDVIKHLETCKECRDELEIHYILQYGLDEDDSKVSMNFIRLLNNNIAHMKRRYRHYIDRYSFYLLVQISAYTAMTGSLIYVIFKYFLK